MRGERHRIAQAARIDLDRRVRVAGLQGREDAVRRRRERPYRRERRRAFAGGAGLRFGCGDGALVVRRADVDVEPARSVEHELFERMKAPLRRAVGQFDLQAGKPLNDHLDRRFRRRGQGVEPKHLFRRARVDAPVDPDRQSVRQIEARHQHLDAFALGRPRIQQQQAALAWAPPAHVGDDEQVRARDLDDRARENETIGLAGDEAGAIAGPHADRELRKSERSLAAALGTQRVAIPWIVALCGRRRERLIGRRLQTHPCDDRQDGANDGVG